MKFLNKNKTANCNGNSTLTKSKKFAQKVFLATSIFVMTTVPVYADGAGGTGSNPAGLNNVSSVDIISQIINVLLTIFQFVGVFSLVQGIALAVLGQRSDDPERRSKGVTEAIIGGVLVGLGFLLDPILKLIGITL